jgi:hypothetical protein
VIGGRGRGRLSLAAALRGMTGVTEQALGTTGGLAGTAETGDGAPCTMYTWQGDVGKTTWAKRRGQDAGGSSPAAGSVRALEPPHARPSMAV